MSKFSVRLLFLDIDGVLNSESYDRIQYCRCKYGFLGYKGENEIDPRAMTILGLILLETRCQVIVSSSWRKTGAPLIKKMLEDEFGIGDRVIGVTPKVASYRGIEIQEFFKQIEDKLKVESFVILDDDRDMKPYLNRLILIDGRIGLQGQDVDRIKKTLACPVKWKGEDQFIEEDCWDDSTKYLFSV